MIKKFLLTVSIICFLFNLNAQKSPSINGVPLGMVSYTYRQSLQKDMATTLDSLKTLIVTLCCNKEPTETNLYQ